MGPAKNHVRAWDKDINTEPMFMEDSSPNQEMLAKLDALVKAGLGHMGTSTRTTPRSAVFSIVSRLGRFKGAGRACLLYTSPSPRD
eukprot:1220574-Alexandrium_andersonii.AAC.1